MLTKILTAYRKLDLIEYMFQYLSNDSDEDKDRSQSLTKVSSVNNAVDKNELSFNASVLIKNIAMHSIERDDMFFLGKLMDRYEQIITQSSVAITDAIISSLEDQHESGKQPTFILEKFKTVEKVSYMYIAETTSVLKFVRVLYKLLRCPPKRNFIANSLNPLRDFVMILKLLDTMDKTVVGMKEEFDTLQSSLVELLTHVVDNVEPNGVLRNWLFDDFDDELKVIDYLGQFRVLDLLQHPKIVKTVEQIWYGNYDWKKAQSLITAMKSTNAGIVYRSLNLNLDLFFSVFGPNKWLGTLYYNFKILYNVVQRHFKRVQDHKMNKIDFDNREMEKAPFLGYIAFVSSIYVQHFADYILFAIVSTVLIVLFVLMINYQKSLEQMADEISILQAQSQTAEVVTQITEKYNELEETGAIWFSIFRACCGFS